MDRSTEDVTWRCEEVIASFDSGEAESDMPVPVREHLNDCDECRDLVSTLQTVSSALEADGISDTSTASNNEFIESFWANVDAERSKFVEVSSGRASRAARVWAIAASVLVAAGLALVWQSGFFDRPATDPSPPVESASTSTLDRDDLPEELVAELQKLQEEELRDLAYLVGPERVSDGLAPTAELDTGEWNVDTNELQSMLGSSSSSRKRES